MRNWLGAVILAMVTCVFLVGDAALAQPVNPAPEETPAPPAEGPLTGTGRVSPSPHSASADSVDIDTRPRVARRSYKMACQVNVGSCSIAADGPGLSCYCDAKGEPSRYWGMTVAP